jgi:ribosomal protein S27AE
MDNNTRIRSIAPATCPQCGGERTFAVLEDRVKCRRCGYIQQKTAKKPKRPSPQPAAQPYERAQRNKAQNRFSRTRREKVNPRAEAAFSSAEAHVWREEWDEAINALRRAIDNERDFIDAHLWLAMILDDPDERRDHLSTVLSNVNNHVEATREIMLLNGELTENEAERAFDQYAEPEVRRVEGAVGTQTENLRCPRCGSPNMTIDDETGDALCGSCGFVGDPAAAQSSGGGTLAQALLKRRAQPVRWVIGERLLSCESCGAERTIPARKLSMICPFCGSNHVIERDVLDSFQQPDGLLPFKIRPENARELIKEKLDGWQERIKGWFTNNNVENTRLEGVFLPYWVFDSAVEVRKTTTRTGSYQGNERNRYTPVPAYESITISDAMNNVMICAVSAPPPQLTRRLDNFSLGDMRDYTPKLLSKFPAEIYDVDFDKASLKARGVISTYMKERHQILNPAREGARVTITASVQAMTFQLVLAPVWVMTLFEEDGDVRPALVNGQTGQVVLGKAQKPVWD